MKIASQKLASCLGAALGAVVLFSRAAQAEYIGSPSAAAAPMGQAMSISTPLVSVSQTASAPRDVIPVDKVDYARMIFEDGYAFPYHLKHLSFYDVSMDLGGSSLGLFRWNYNDDNNKGVPDNTQRIQRWILYTYLNARYKQYLRFHLRLRNRYHFEDFEPINNNNEGVDFNQMYGQVLLNPFTFTMGRQFEKLGRGHTMRAEWDAYKLGYADDFIEGELFTGRLVGSNQDVFLPYNRQKKYAWGAKVTYKEFKKHLFQGYVIRVKDRSEDGLDARDSHYEPTYFGFHAKGRFDVRKHNIRHVDYYTELIRVAGETHNSDLGDASTHFNKEDIKAYLVDFGAILKYDHPWKPEFEAQYTLGSGDNSIIPPDGRVASVRRGNPAGSKASDWRDLDGFVPYGVALNPRETNLSIVKFAMDAQPLDRLQMGMDYFRYWKIKKKGVISDIQAHDSDRDVGFEVDLRLRYRLNKYARLDAVYGHFFPGAAFIHNNEDGEELFQMILSYVF